MTITYENLLAFLYREARLLDDKQWEEWLQLYAPDVEFQRLPCLDPTLSCGLAI